MCGHEHRTKWYTTSQAAGFQGRSIDALLRICGRLMFTAELSTGIVSYNRDGPVRRRMRFARRQVVDADLRIYVQEVRALHTAAANGGMRVAVRLPGMRRACSPCPSDRTRLPHRVGRSASGRRKVRAQHRRIARPAAILARSCWIDQEVETCPEAETCTGESVSARLTDLASARPGEFPSGQPVFRRQVHGARCGAHAPASTSGRGPSRGCCW